MTDGKKHEKDTQARMSDEWSNILTNVRATVPPSAEKSSIILPEDEQNPKSDLKIGDKVGKYGIYRGKRGVYDARNSLNDMTGKEWVLFTRSWFIHNPPARGKDEKLHPAKFPESMVGDFIKFFTKPKDVVLDPMLGSGSTLVACITTGRKGVGVELTKKWCDIARNRTNPLEIPSQPKQTVIEGDSHDLKNLLETHSIESVDFCITSPPYWNMLSKSRGHVKSEAQKREEQGLDVVYSSDTRDFGNIASYDEYLDSMFHLFEQVHHVLKEGKYLVIFVQNILTSDGEMVPLAWDLAKRLSRLFVLKQERIWLQDNKSLGCWGYPREYVSNVHHHYCLILKKDTCFHSKVKGL